MEKHNINEEATTIQATNIRRQCFISNKTDFVHWFVVGFK